MSALSRALWAEHLKLRGTLAAWMCLVAPAVVVLVYVLQVSFSRFPANRPPLPGDEAWNGFMQATLVLWAFLMLPLLVTLQAALLAGLDHQGNQWKHLLALAPPRRVHYLAKLLGLAALVAMSQLAMFLLLPLGGAVLSVVKPAFGLVGGPPWAALARELAEIYAACLMLVALHTWIALRWRSFAVAVGVGMAATVMGFLIGQSARFGPWYPWSLPMQTLASDPAIAPQVAAYSLAAAIVLAVLGLAWFRRSEPA
ncbi:ABC transporter permease [Arenimonas sp.]|uniref:ABC transporter permease n=1 Tax=Arenimonas sp. TaxID=1872635 RepID=UPI0035AE222A